MDVEKIRALCMERGTNFKQLEIALGFGNGAISRWGDSPPAVTKVKAVADYFGVTVDELLRQERTSNACPYEKEGRSPGRASRFGKTCDCGDGTDSSLCSE